MGRSDGSHRKMHGVEKPFAVARRGHGTAFARGGRGRG